MSEFHNYFNYFTEIEEHFQRARGTSLFLLSPLDWALIESWKSSGIPLVAVLRGIDASFEKKLTRRAQSPINSLAFCAQAVLTEAQRVGESSAESPVEEPFARAEVREYLIANSAILRSLEGFEEVERALSKLVEDVPEDLEELERRLTLLEQKTIAIARANTADDDLLADTRDLKAQLQPYRRKMSASQLDMLERQFLERKLLERHGLPRLSLFYLK